MIEIPASAARRLWHGLKLVVALACVVALMWLHIGVVFPRVTVTLLIQSDVPLFNVGVTMDGVPLSGQYGTPEPSTVFAWAIPEPLRGSRYAVNWSASDGRVGSLERSASFDERARHCIYVLRINAEARATREDWTTICRCDPPPIPPHRHLSPGECQ